jgi:glycosyltransferase involved in cell wall biosynthesis/O-antigen/teichoic acid export membrane protein
MKALADSALLKRRLWDNEIYSSLAIMVMRAGMLAAKFVLSVFLARYMGLKELGIYGLIVGTSGTIQAILRGGIFLSLARNVVHQPVPELVHDLRHYITGILTLYFLLIPVALFAGHLYFTPQLAMLALAVFLTEHLAFDCYVLINNLQYPKLANFVYSLQSASWIYLFVILAFLFPGLRSLEALLGFWAAGGTIALGIAIWLSRHWPWKAALSRKLEWQWYQEKIRVSKNLYFSSVLEVLNYYLDRYIVSLVLDLEMTGVYVFFSQIVTATWNLINSGVMVPYAPRLIKAYDDKDMVPFNSLYRSCLKRACMGTVILAVISGIVVPFMATFAGKEALLNHLPLLWLMLIALLFRICATSAGAGLFAMHKDRENFYIAVIGFLITTIVGTAAVIAYGLYGIVLNTVIVSLVSIGFARAAWGKTRLSAAKENANDARGKNSAEAAHGKKSKKILIISSTFPPHIFGGAEVAAYNRARLLAKRGHRVSVATLHERNMKPAWGEMSPEGFRLYRIKTPRSYTLFERTKSNPVWRKILWHLQDYFDKRNQVMFGRLLEEVKPDHIDVDNLIGFGFNALAEIGRRDVPAAYILHDLNLVCFNTCMFRNGKTCMRQCISCRGVAALRQTHLNKIPRLGFVSPSHATLESAKRFIPMVRGSLSRVIRNVPEPLPIPIRKEPSGHIRLLFAGRLDPVKGIEFLLDVLDSLSHLHEFHLTVLGTGPGEKHLREKFGKMKWVDFRGFVPGSEVTKALMKCDLYCIPSLMAESYGLVTAQALQLGTPVIGSSIGGTTELVRHEVTGLLVPPGDEAAWRSALSRTFADRNLLAAWHGNAVRLAQEFSEDAIGQAHEEFIEMLSRQSA